MKALSGQQPEIVSTPLARRRVRFLDALSVRQRDLLTAGSLLAATLFLRIPFRSHVLTNVDSVNFALGLERYSVVEGQPHPPGDFLYIAAAHVFEFVFRDATAALIALSIFSAAAAVAGLFFLGRHIFGYRTGLAAAVLLLFSPVAWYYGEIALSYEVEAALVVACVWMLHDMIFLRRRAVAAAVLLAIAGGFRIDTLAFLLPVFIWATVRMRRRDALLAWGTLTGLTLAWGIPFVLLLPDAGAYLDVLRVQFPAATTVETSGLQALWHNFTFVVLGDMWLYGGAVVLVLLLGFLLIRADRRDLFLLALPAPALLFFCLEHFSQFGYLLVFSAPLFLLGARVILLVCGWAGEELARMPVSSAGIERLAMMGILALIILCNSWLFFRGDRSDLPTFVTSETVSQAFGHYTRPSLVKVDSDTAQISQLIHGYDPDDTLIVSIDPDDTFGWRKLMYYFPEFRTVGIGRETSSGLLFDARYHYAPDFLYRHGKVGEWRRPHYDVQIGPRIRNVLVFDAARNKVTPYGLTPVAGDVGGDSVWLGHPGDGREEVVIGAYRIHR